MKRIWSCLLALLLLAGCGGEAQEEKGPPAGEMSFPESKAAPTEGPVTMETEWETYARSVDRVWFTLENTGTETVEFGAEYSLETLGENGAWYQVPTVENAGWESIAYVLAPGGKFAQACGFSLFDYDFSGGGTYRIVKTVGEQTLAAEFTLAEGARISAETPYGGWPLEDVPEEAHPSELAEGGAVVFTGAGTENLELAAEFLEKVSLGIPCQLRTVQDYYESWPMVIDVIYENDSFLWRMRTGGEITEKRFSYVVTDGTDVYLSNGADWESTEAYDSDKAFLLPAGSGASLATAAEAMTVDRLAGNTVRYRTWSADGVWDAFLTRTPSEFGVGWQRPGEGSGGSLYDLGSWYDEELSVTGIVWEDDGTLSLTCRTAAGGAIVPTFDPETGMLTEVMRGDPRAE